MTAADVSKLALGVVERDLEPLDAFLEARRRGVAGGRRHALLQGSLIGAAEPMMAAPVALAPIAIAENLSILNQEAVSDLS